MTNQKILEKAIKKAIDSGCPVTIDSNGDSKWIVYGNSHTATATAVFYDQPTTHPNLKTGVDTV